MRKLNFLLSILFLGSLTFSCGESSRDEVHEEVVEAERAQDDVVIGIGPEPIEREIDIVASDLDYQPNEITVKAGQELSVSLLNQGKREHNIEFELPSGEKMLEKNVKPGTSSILEFEAPEEAGTYTFYCPVDDHHEKGMEGRLIVVKE